MDGFTFGDARSAAGGETGSWRRDRQCHAVSPTWLLHRALLRSPSLAGHQQDLQGRQQGEHGRARLVQGVGRECGAGLPGGSALAHRRDRRLIEPVELQTTRRGILRAGQARGS